MHRATPITRSEYAPYGDLIAPADTPPRVANHGTAHAWDALGQLHSTRLGARCSLALFRCLPLGARRLTVRRLERHPHSTQLFAPLSGGRFLVVVAPPGAAPDLTRLRAFVVPPGVAITYHPGVWHHPMVALDRVTEFVNALHADGTSEDCHEVEVEGPDVLIDTE